MDRATASFLQATTLWRRLPKSVLAEALAATTRLELRRRQALWAPASPATDLYVVRSGVVRIHRPADGHDGLTLSFHGRGDLCGEVGTLAAALGATTQRHTRAVTHEDTTLFAMPAATLSRLMSEHASLGAELAALVATRRRAVETRLSKLPFQSVPERLEAALCDLAVQFGIRDARGILVDLRLTHRDLAALVGSTRETVSAVLARWRRAERLVTEGRRLVLPIKTVRTVAGIATPHILRRAG
ncbi:MAG: Crp/Fnr family transcriptional regulator [Myxococcota bacterium]